MTGNWAEPYLGIPWVLNGEDRTGCDCWGLVRLVLAEQRGLRITHPSALAAGDAAAIGRRFARLRELVLGDVVLRPAEDGPRDCDLVEMRIHGPGADHIGLIAHGMVLHARARIGSHLTPLDRLPFPILARWRHG